MRYIGSKGSMIGSIYDLISHYIPTGSFCDPFAGIGTVGSYFRLKGYNVWSGDILNFAYFFQIARLKHSQPLSFNKIKNRLGLDNDFELENYLNSLKSKSGWFVNEYSEKRNFFLKKNAQKIQACKREIFEWNKKGWLSYDEHAVLLASLINCMDKVANTAGTYYAYLKKLYRKACNDFNFELIKLVPSIYEGHCFHEPAKLLVKRGHFNILYLDPPFNNRSYAHYYHLPETIALEKTPKVFGLSGIPKNILNVSEFNRRNDAKNALIDILNNANFDLLVFHYTDNGIITPEEISDIVSSIGKTRDFLLESKGYTTEKKSRNIKHHLYLVQND
jgi:adenine-specific DNA-methyltransferase